MKLTDMGTTGLIDWVIAGGWKMRGCRRAQAARVIESRYKNREATNRFHKAVSGKWLRTHGK